MSTFTSYIKKQQNRNDNLGDYARDFVFLLKNYPKYREYRGTDKILSETLWDHYQYLDKSAQNRDYVLEALCSLWKEWLKYKHIGLRFERPKRGYVYFFRIHQRENVFKIGRTKTDPEKRLAQVAINEKANIEIYDWIKIDRYDIIEKEIHEAFSGSRLIREWFEVSPDTIDEVIHLYALTDCDPKIYSIILEEQESD